MSCREEVGVSFVVLGVLEPQIARHWLQKHMRNPEELWLHHNHEQFLFFTVLSQFLHNSKWITGDL
jgi:hypothetical protein